MNSNGLEMSTLLFTIYVNYLNNNVTDMLQIVGMGANPLSRPRLLQTLSS